MIGRRLAISGKGRIGRDRFDPQQGKQPLEAVIEIGIDAVEDRLKLRRVGHLDLPLASGCYSAYQVLARLPSETRNGPCCLKADAGCARPIPRQSCRERRGYSRRPADPSEKWETTGTAAVPRLRERPKFPSVPPDADHRLPDVSGWSSERTAI